MDYLHLAVAVTGLILWVWAVVLLLLNKREPSSTLAWLMFVTLLPMGGPLMFLVLGPQRLERKAIRRKRRLGLTGATETENRWDSKSLNVTTDEQRCLHMASQVSDYNATGGNEVTLFVQAQDALLHMRQAIAAAKHFVHLEFYIIATDEVTELLFDDLLEAARRGVEVRLLYDTFGSLSLKRLSLLRLEKAGVRVAAFLPFSLWPHHINPHFRNHRKILIVDGTTAFTGGANIGKEYLGRAPRTTWRDYLIRIRGPACTQLEEVFAKDWQFTTKEDLLQEKYAVDPGTPGDTVIQVIESGPDTPFQALHKLMFLAVNSAEEEILLTTPYFIPDPAITAALTVAALRGVRVQLLLPSKSDAPLVQWASRSFYDELLDAGVSLHNYQPSILHAKMLCIDGRWSIFGSANMDIRSFRLNFELNVLMFGEKVGSTAAAMFQVDRANSRPVDKEEFARRSVSTRILENACRLLSPIL